MKNTILKPIFIASILILTNYGCNQAETKPDAIEEFVEVIDVEAETKAVKSVMQSYKDAIQNLTTEGTNELFTTDATVFESGGFEGTYKEYESHHLGPELDYFSLFEFSDYSIDVTVDLPYAFTTESYVYTIEIKENIEEEIEARTIIKSGVATSVLKKNDGIWKITRTHSSSREFSQGHH